MDAKPILFAATVDPDKSLPFYQETLGLKFIADHPYAMVFDNAGIMLRLQKVDKLEPSPYTVLGWEVEDIKSSVAELESKGVTFERFPFLVQDDNGIWLTPDGARVVWFKDPDGNLLSLTQGS